MKKYQMQRIDTYEVEIEATSQEEAFKIVESMDEKELNYIQSENSIVEQSS